MAKQVFEFKRSEDDDEIIKVSVSAVFGASKEPGWDGSHGDQYRITVGTDQGRMSFDYWNSYHDMQNDKSVKLENALGVFICEALDGLEYNEDTLADEFGYSPSESRRVYREMQRFAKAAARLGLDESALIAIVDKLDR